MPIRRTRRTFRKRAPKRTKRTKRFKKKGGGKTTSYVLMDATRSGYKNGLGNMGSFNASVQPFRLKSICSYIDNQPLIGSGGGVATFTVQTYRLNSIWDPNSSVGSSQLSAYGYSILAELLYQNYRVDYCDMEIQYYCVSKIDVGLAASVYAVGFVIGGDSASQNFTAPYAFLAWDSKTRKYQDYNIMSRSAAGAISGNTTIQGGKKNMSGFFKRRYSMKDLYKRYGDADNVNVGINSLSFLSTKFGDNPLLGFNVNLWAQSLREVGSLFPLPTINYIIKLKYYVTAYNPKKPYGTEQPTTLDNSGLAGPTGTYFTYTTSGTGTSQTGFISFPDSRSDPQ